MLGGPEGEAVRGQTDGLRRAGPGRQGLETGVEDQPVSNDYRIAAGLGVLSEVQAGGAIFCDPTYLANGAHTRPSLFVRSMVTSRPASIAGPPASR